MTDIDLSDKDALSLHLRSKTALGRLTDAEVHTVLDYLTEIGFGVSVAPAEPAPAPSIEPAPVVEVLPAPAAPADDPAPLAPPPAP